MNVIVPDLRFFRYFETLASSDAPSTAAKTLDVSFDDFRRDIIVFEEKLLKTPLFDRASLSRRSKIVSRTEEGDELLPWVRRLLERTSDALRAIGQRPEDCLSKLAYLDMRHFDKFAKLVDAGSIAALARSSGRHDERINTDLKQFEDDYLRTRLFERPRRPLRLTDAGRALLPYARSVAEALNDIFSSVHAPLPAETVLRVGLASTPSSQFYPAAKQIFEERYPLCVIRDTPDSTDNLIKFVREGGIDLAFVIEPLPTVNDLKYEELYKCVVCCAMSWTHKLARSKAVTLKQISQERLVAYSAASYPQYHRYLAKFFKGKVPPIVAECEDHKRLIEHIERSKRRVALVPLQMDSHTEGRIALIPVKPTIRVGVGALSLNSANPLSRAFITIAKDCAITKQKQT